MFPWNQRPSEPHLIHWGGTNAPMVSRHGRILFLKARISKGCSMGFFWEFYEGLIGLNELLMGFHGWIIPSHSQLILERGLNWDFHVETAQAADKTEICPFSCGGWSQLTLSPLKVPQAPAGGVFVSGKDSPRSSILKRLDDQRRNPKTWVPNPCGGGQKK